MYKKVFKDNKEYYAIKVEDINNVVGDLIAILGKHVQFWAYDDFNNYIVLFQASGPNLIVDAVKHNGFWLTVCKEHSFSNIFDLYTEEDFNNNFINVDEENKTFQIISFDYFKSTLDFIKEQDEKMNNFCNALEQLSPGEYCNCFLYSDYEDRLLTMMTKAMHLNVEKINILMWWLYDMEWGTKVTLESCATDLTTIEKLYNYLIGE